MYTEQLTQSQAMMTPILPQVLTGTTTLTTGSVHVDKCKRAIFELELGAFGGTAPTCSAVLTVQESPDNSTWTANALAPTLTVSAGSTGGTVEIRSDQLGAGKKYVRASVAFTIGGTSPTIPVRVGAKGGASAPKPASLLNDTTTFPVANQLVT
jgi:hypothetical protein